MKRITIALLFFLFGTVSTASADTLDEVIAKVQKTYSALKDYQAGFIQEVTGTVGARGGSGTLYVKTPAKMRWDYVEPTPKQLITDGKTSWMYLPDEKQVYVQPLDAQASAQIPLLMLTGKIDFKKDYDASLLEDQGEQYRIQLKPKKQGVGFDHALVYIDKATTRIARFELFDLYGSKTSIALKDPKINQGLKDSMFVYEKKPGVEELKAPQ